MITPITSGPKFHWFGYYDKRQFDYSSNRVLSMEVDFEHRSPKADDQITIGMIDLKLIRSIFIQCIFNIFNLSIDN